MSETNNRDQRRLVQALVGPDGPELTCEQCFDQLDHYVELEVRGSDPDTAIPGMRAHLDGCSACDEDHRSLLAVVQGGPPAPEPPPAE